MSFLQSISKTKMSNRIKRARRLLFLIAVLLKSFGNYAQEGELYIANFWPYQNYASDVWSIAQGHNDNMFFGTRKGLISFDADHWNYIPTGNIPFALHFDSISGRMYVGCLNKVGYLDRDEFGMYEFNTIYHPKEETGIVYDIILDSNYLYCLSEYALSKVAISDTSDKKEWISTTEDNFTGAFLHDGKVYLNISEAGLFVIEQDTIWPTVKGYKLSEVELIFSINISEKQVLLGTSNNELLLFENGDFKPFSIKDRDYIQNSVLSDGLKVNDSTIAISTLIGGCLIIDIETGKTLHTLNYQTGLPDDEVFALASDNGGGLWLSHSKGLSRVDKRLPIKNFASYPGLEGSLLSLITQNDDLYVLTSESVFYLEELKDYTEKVVLKKSEKEEVYLVGNQKRKQKKGFFSFFKGKKRPKETTQTIKAEKKKKRRFKIFGRTKDEQLVVEEESDEAKEKLKEKIYELRSVTHRFKKIPGVNDKCKQAVELPDRLVVAANNGLYEIINKRARIIIEGDYFHGVTVSKEKNTLAAFTPDHVYILQLLNNKWRVEKHPSPDDYLSSIYIHSKDSLWLGGYDVVYKAVRENPDNQLVYTSYSLNSGLFEPVNVRQINNEIFLFQPSALNRISGENIIPLSKDHAIRNYPGNRIISNEKYTWIKSNGSWDCLPSDTNFSQIISFLGLVDQIKHIHSDKENNLWVISDNNQLLKINLGDSLNLTALAPKVYITSIATTSGMKVDLNNPVISRKNKSLVFKVAAPLFLKQNATYYQFYVDGLMDTWSQWSKDATISFPYMPAGEYTLQVKAKSILGVESQIESVDFKVKAPFWKSKVFLLMLGISLIISIYFLIITREKGLKEDSLRLSSQVNASNKIIHKQKQEIENHQEELDSTLKFAKRIQTAAFPSTSQLNEILSDYFIFYKPRNIVGGDFYWATRYKEKLFITAADCSGHGITGAFLSMLGVSLLNEVVIKNESKNASEILNTLYATINERLKKDDHVSAEIEKIRLALCIINTDKTKMQFSGAYNPVLLVREGQLYDFNANTQKNGGVLNKQTTFTNNVIDLNPTDRIYLFTDGYAGQVGGPENRKMLINDFKDILLRIHSKPMESQKQELEAIFKTWSKDTHQLDDVLVIGMRV